MEMEMITWIYNIWQTWRMATKRTCFSFISVVDTFKQTGAASFPKTNTPMQAQNTHTP